jgi:DNA-binding transcriptional LysR family regulator
MARIINSASASMSMARNGLGVFVLNGSIYYMRELAIICMGTGVRALSPRWSDTAWSRIAGPIEVTESWGKHAKHSVSM